MLKYYTLLWLATTAVSLTSANAQALDLSRLPKNYHLSADGQHLVRGRVDNARLYSLEEVPVVEFLFAEDNWFELVDSIGLLGSVVFEGDTLREVFVEVKGSSTDYGNTTLKKSFNVEIDAVNEDQDVAGYTSLNLHSGIYDNSHLREPIFYDISRRHLPASQSNFVELRINGKPWGAYINTQQIDGKFLGQWFFDGSGPRWRGESPFGRVGGGEGCADATEPGKPPSGSGLLYFGTDSADYFRYYTNRGKHEAGDWDKLVRVITKLNLTSDADLQDTLPKYLAIDETLWFLAHEILLTDGDGYVFKTQSDFQLYIDPSTGQLVPLEYDGNGGINSPWNEVPPTFRASEVCVPLINKLLSVPRWRQRYLAHFRDLVREQYDTAYIGTRIDKLGDLIDELERNDTIGSALVTYQQFRGSRYELKQTIRGRYEYLATHPDLRPSGIAVTAAGHIPTDPTATTIDGGADYFVTATVSATDGLGEVYVHVAPDPRVLPKGTSARYRETRMFDDGAHGDGAAGDGVYGARLTAQRAGALHRYYFEVTGATPTAPSEIFPTGGEHETFYFLSTSVVASQLGPVRINELMSDNETGATDEEGKFEDWIELYNDSDSRVDLSGFAISDDPTRPQRYVFPDGVAIEARGYLIIWADDDQDDGPLHTNFNLSKNGESLSLVDRNGTVVDTVTFPALLPDSAYARRPDGTGPWRIAKPTFGVTNGTSVGVRNTVAFPGARLYPNPSAGSTVALALPREGLEVGLFDPLGRQVWHRAKSTTARVDIPTAGLTAGVYVITVRGSEGTQHFTLVRQ